MTKFRTPSISLEPEQRCDVGHALQRVVRVLGGDGGAVRGSSRMTAADEGDHAHAGAFAGLDAGRTVLDDDAAFQARRP